MDTDPRDGLIGRALDAVDVERLVATARLLIDTPSPTGSELACAQALGDRLESFGVRASVDRFETTRANVVATVGDEAAAGVMFNGHLDTTGYGDERDRAWLYEHGPGDLARSTNEDGILAGLGAYNMKGGVAAATEALLALSTVGGELPRSVTLAAVAGESEKAPIDGLLRAFGGPDVTGGGAGTSRLLAQGLTPTAVVICEPSGLAVVNAQPGYVLIRVLVRGRAGYLPPPGSPTVLSAATGVVDAIRAWAVDYADRAALDCGLGVMRPSCTVGAIESGWPFKPGGTPAVAAIYVDLRIPPHLEPGEPVEALREVAATSAAAAGSFRTELESFARHLPGALVPSAHPLILAARSAVERATGGPPPAPSDDDFPPGDDGKIFAARGIPYVKLGPGTPVGRDPRFGREQVRVADLASAARAYVVLAVALATMDDDALAAAPAVLTEPGAFRRRASDTASD